MTTRLITISDCKEGDILAESLSGRYGAIIAAEYTVLNGYMIGRLSELGVRQIRIYDEYSGDDCPDNISHCKAKKNYKDIILSIKSILTELIAGRSLNAKKIIESSDAVFCELYDNCHILNVLNEEKELDEYTYTHSLNVALYSMLIGKWLKLDGNSIKDVIKAGLLHDIGKTKIPIEILNKKARLSDEEFEIIRKHALYGYEIIKSTGCLPNDVCKAVLLHHEREDKSGYPFGFGGGQLGLYEKILAVADVYDAMTSDRVYKKRATPFEVFEMFKTVGVRSFDSKIVKTFLTYLSACYVGAKVTLSTGEAGEVVYIPPHSITKPVVNVDGIYMDLGKERDRRIISVTF